MESEYQTMAHKTVYGFQETNSDLVGGHIIQTLLRDAGRFVEKCIGWQYDIFKNLSKKQRWKTVKIHELCFCCLAEGHKVVECSWGSTCNIFGCLKKHSRMLHSADQEDELEHNPTCQSKISLMEGEEQQNTSIMAAEV